MPCLLLACVFSTSLAFEMHNEIPMNRNPCSNPETLVCKLLICTTVPTLNNPLRVAQLEEQIEILTNICLRSLLEQILQNQSTLGLELLQTVFG